ncbi:MAG: hypothetical protein AAF593_10895 [Planctomycetota bacterium]
MLGAGGIMFGLLGMLGPATNTVFRDLSPPEQAAVYDAQTQYQWIAVGISTAATLIALLLLWGGIALLKRRATAIRLLKTWAVLKLLLTLPMVVFQGFVQSATWDAMAAQPSAPAVPEMISTIMVVFTVTIGLIWSAAFPVFVLIWFRRKKITAEIRSWADEPGREGLEA